MVAAVAAAALLSPDLAWADEFAAVAAEQPLDESFSAGLLRTLVADEQALGGAAPYFYAVGVAAFELLPLATPQPLSTGVGLLASVTRARLWLSLLAGLFFGPLQGGLLNLAGSTGAACVAFAKARTDEGPSTLLWALEKEDSSGTFRKLYNRIKGVIDSGSLWQQAAVISFLRLTPLAPFRAISYYLGLTPIRFGAFLVGTAAGRGFWSLLYASIGAYFRSRVHRGVGFDGLLTEIGDVASLYTREVIIVGVLLSVGAAGAWLIGVVGPNAPGLPEEGEFLDRLRQRRDVAKEGTLQFVRRVVPSEDWLTAGFWLQAADNVRGWGKGLLSAALDDGEGELETWLHQKGEDTPLRKRAAAAVRKLQDGAEQIGVDPQTLRTQMRRINEKLGEIRPGNDGSSGSSGSNNEVSGKLGSQEHRRKQTSKRRDNDK